MNEKDKAIRAKFEARYLSMLAPFMATHDIRYYLNGFLIRRAEKGVHLAATNGHVLCIIKDTDGVLEGADEVIIRRDLPLIRAAKGRAKAMPQNVIIEGGRVSVAQEFGCAGTDCETFVMAGKPFIEGKFPDYGRLIPDFAKLKPGIQTSAVNPKYMALFAPLVANSMQVMRLWQSEDVGVNKGRPIVVQLPAIPELMGIIMPIHDDDRSRAEDLAAVQKVFA